MNDPAAGFIVTNEYRRFAEFADAVRRDRYIGLCYGTPGVGKTLSARHYSRWDEVGPHLAQRAIVNGREIPSRLPPDDLASQRTVMWTPAVMISPSRLDDELRRLCNQLRDAVRAVQLMRQRIAGFEVEIVIVDEADRLKTSSLEQLRDFYDRNHPGLILIGMPGLERRLSRYPQFYSRVGFAHEYRPLTGDELTAVLSEHPETFGLRLPSGGFNDPDALAAVARITSGNLRLIQRLFSQINRILEINQLTTITQDVVETARESLIIGPR